VKSAVRLGRRMIAGIPERYRAPVAIGLLMLLAVGLSVSLFSHQSLRLDEAQSLWQSSRTPTKILDIIAQDVNLPLYVLMLHFWQVIFGNGVEITRILSLLFFLATIPAIYVLGRESYGRNIGLFGALLFTVSPFMNWYANELRTYSLLALLTVLSQIFFLRIFRVGGRASWISYVATAIIGIFTHYFFFFVLLTQGLFFLVKRKAFVGRPIRNSIISGAILALAFAPWVAYVVKLGAASNTKPLLQHPTTIDLFNTYSQFLFGFQNDHVNTLVVSLWPVIVLLGFLSLRKIRRVPSETLYFFMAASLPIVAAFVVSISFSPLYLTRYLIISLPALYLFVGWIFSTYPPRLGNVLRAGLIVVMLATLTQEVVSPTTPVKEDYREASQYLNTHTDARDVVIVSAPFTIYPVEYYYRGQAEISTLPIWNRYVSGPVPPFSESKLPQEVDRLRASHQRAYVLLSQDQGYEEKIRSYLDGHYQRVDQQYFSGKLALYVYQLRYDSPTLSQRNESAS